MTAMSAIPRQGLYDPALEHDACGVAFVANIRGERSHEVVSKGLEVLVNLEHRGACGCDPETGDGAGLLVQLPDAFLRRCVFHFIDFPEPDLMREIVDVHHKNLDATLLDQVLIKFYWLRGQRELRKKPSTSELIDWISALLRSGMNAQQIEAHLPFMGTLLKNEQDTEALDQFDESDSQMPSSWSDLGPRYQQ